MPFLKYIVVYSFFLLVSSVSVFSQARSASVLYKKYTPAQLKEDAVVLKNVIMKMHPAIGIYRSREYYNRLFDDFIASIKDSMTEKAFRFQMKLVMDELHCGHTETMYSNKYVKAFSKLKLTFSPYAFVALNNKVFVLDAVNHKRDTLLKRGTQITKINGIGTDSILRVCKKLITTDGFNTSGKNHYVKLGFNSYYPAVFGKPDTFKVEYIKDSTIKTVKYPIVSAKKSPVIPLTAADDKSFKVYKRAKVKYKYLDSADKTMFVKIYSFSRKGYGRAYKRIFRSLQKKQAQNLVIDLRYNGGGSLENSYRLLSYLLDSNRTQTLKTAIRSYPYKEYTRGNIWFKLMRFGFGMISKKSTIHDTDNFVYTIKPHKKFHYDKNVYVLINGGSFSASCLVGAYLKFHNRATFIGEETSGTIEGCNAGITPYYKLPNTGIRVRVPAFRIVHDVSPQITGHGIIPDYPVVYSIKDVLNKKDLELEKVRALTNKK